MKVALVMFSIAMAALEAAVVVYLRALYYEGGFTVAFQIVDPSIVGVELIREISTIVMLAAVGYIAGKTWRARFAWFLVCFAVWDLGYYAWLKVFIDWPGSWFDWDILFLIPVTWLAPVLAPVVCSFTMLMLAWAMLRLPDHEQIDLSSWLAILCGSAVILLTFMIDYATLLSDHELWPHYFTLPGDKRFAAIAASFLPEPFEWFLFWIGESILIFAVLHIAGINRFKITTFRHA